jgi:opacity protein-like surface antigen
MTSIQKILFWGAASVAVVASSAPAYATKALTSPYVTKGRAVAEWRGGYDFMEHSEDDRWRMRAITSYGVTSFWDTRIAGTWSHDDETVTDAVAWENKFQLTEKGQLPVDLGMRLDYSKATNTNPDEILVRLLAAKKIGPVGQILNLSLGRQVGDEASNNVGFDMGYGISYDLSENYALGIEYYGDFDDFDNNYSEQIHHVGPVVYGTHGPIKYQVGALVGVSNAAPDVALKTTLSYSFDFLK